MATKRGCRNLLTNRLVEARKGLEQALQAVVTLCEVVDPQTREGFFGYFVYQETLLLKSKLLNARPMQKNREAI